MKNFQQKLQHLETLLEEKAREHIPDRQASTLKWSRWEAAKIDALSAESAEAAATTFSKACWVRDCST